MNAYILFIVVFFNLNYNPHQTGVVIGTCAGVFGFVDRSASGKTNLFGNSPAGNTEFFETTN